MTAIDIPDLREPWPRGDPEIELHIAMPDAQISGSKPWRCMGGWSGADAHFNMETNHWYGELDGGDDLLFLPASVLDQMATTTSYPDINATQRNLVLEVWEDDYNACEVHDVDEDQIRRNSYGIGAIIGVIGVAVAVGDTADRVKYGLEIGLSLLAYELFRENFIVAWGEDDFIGTIIDAPSWNAQSGSNILRTHAIRRGSSTTGGINIHWRDEGYYY